MIIHFKSLLYLQLNDVKQYSVLYLTLPVDACVLSNRYSLDKLFFFKLPMDFNSFFYIVYPYFSYVYIGFIEFNFEFNFMNYYSY